ncbi:MAG TPA: glycolate oxidase subunit GlcE [Steroidobacteraceae bacterium]
MSDAIADLRERIRAAAADHTPLRIRAGGSKDFYGNTPCGAVLDPRGVSGMVSYEPSELALAVRCGTLLTEIEATLTVHGQMLAFEPPHFGAAATIGGCIASGMAGPRRASVGYTHGGVRDFVLGARLLDGRAQLLSFGGMVMKNVAGYDVARLLAGSLGTLGVIVEVSLKVVPRPRTETTLRFRIDEREALVQLNAWAGRPLPISASAWQSGTLHARLAGSAAAVAAAQAKLGGEALDEPAAERLWLELREHTDAFFGGEAPLWRLSLPPNAAPLELEAAQLIEWGGALRWLRSRRPATQIRARAQALGGHATLFRDPARAPGARVTDAFTPLPPAVLAIHERLRAQFDPAGIFDAGRMYGAPRHADQAR